MPTYQVDVKAFISVSVEAATEEAAREAADAFVESCLTAEYHTIIGYNEGLDNPIGTIVPGDCMPCVDGVSDVQMVDEEGE